MRIWMLGTGTSERYSSYQELKQRGVAAQGWEGLGDLSQSLGNIDQMRKNGQLPKQQFTQLLAQAHPDSNPDETYRIFSNLIIEMKPGDLVLAYDGTELKGIGRLLGNDYIYDANYHYAHTIGPVEWFDIEEIEKVTGMQLKGGIASGQRGVHGIKNLRKNVPIVEEAWRLFQGWRATMSQVSLLSNLAENLRFRSLILQGPPGTGKTRLAKQVAAHLLGITNVNAALDRGTSEYREFEDARFVPSRKRGNQRGAWAITQFHPSCSYEDFVRGIAVQTSGGTVTYRTVRRLLDEMAWEAAQNPEKKYILIIDEVNRANLAAVLGELIYALEYRNEPVHSLYGIIPDRDDTRGPADHLITLPENLYIIGTVNTADRSIGRIDYAVRRRFVFVPLYPDSTVLDTAVQDPGVRELAREMFEAVGSLFSHDSCLSPDFHADDVKPGHSYFIAQSCEELLYKFVFQVIPLLREYVKDGVLAPRDGRSEVVVSLRGIEPISLTKPQPPEQLLERLRQSLCPHRDTVRAEEATRQEADTVSTEFPGQAAPPEGEPVQDGQEGEDENNGTDAPGADAHED